MQISKLIRLIWLLLCWKRLKMIRILKKWICYLEVSVSVEFFINTVFNSIRQNWIARIKNSTLFRRGQKRIWFTFAWISEAMVSRVFILSYSIAGLSFEIYELPYAISLVVLDHINGVCPVLFHKNESLMIFCRHKDVPSFRQCLNRFFFQHMRSRHLWCG